MKAKHIVLIMSIALGLNACSKTDDPEPFFPAELYTANTSLALSFDSLNTDMAANSADIANNINDTTFIRARMLGLFNRSSFVMEFAYVNPQGILQIIEPSAYYSSQGLDISQQEHVKKAFETKQPVLSELFQAVEGLYAAVIMHPIVKEGGLLGAVNALFTPKTILERIITPLVENQTFEMWVMEKGGNILYDQDTNEIGRNLFTDPLYAPFTELIEAGHKIASEPTGETYYSFYQTGTTNKVTKKTYWVTYTLYGTEWKLVWVKPE